MASKTKRPLTLPQRLRKFADELDELAGPPAELTPEQLIASTLEEVFQQGAFKDLSKARMRRKTPEAAEGEDDGGEGAPPPVAQPQPRKRRRSGP